MATLSGKRALGSPERWHIICWRSWWGWLPSNLQWRPQISKQLCRSCPPWATRRSSTTCRSPSTSPADLLPRNHFSQTGWRERGSHSKENTITGLLLTGEKSCIQMSLPSDASSPSSPGWEGPLALTGLTAGTRWKLWSIHSMMVWGCFIGDVGKGGALLPAQKCHHELWMVPWCHGEPPHPIHEDSWSHPLPQDGAPCYASKCIKSFR